MPETPSHRFSIGDAMAMIAAITPSLILIRVGIGFDVFKLGTLPGPGRRPSPLARQLVEILQRRRAGVSLPG